MLLHSLILGVAALTLTASARPVSQTEGSEGLMKREVPQEHSHEQFLTTTDVFLKVDNPFEIEDVVFGLLGNTAAAQGAGKVTNLDCLQQQTADTAFTNAKAAGNVTGMTAALIYRALERNTGAVGLASALCNQTAVNPEIQAVSQHQDPASANAASINKQIALTLAVQIASIGGDPLDAIKSGTFAPGKIGDPTAKGNTCDTQNDPVGCIFTENLLVPDVTDQEISSAIQGGTSVTAAPVSTSQGAVEASATASSGDEEESCEEAAATSTAVASATATATAAAASSVSGSVCKSAGALGGIEPPPVTEDTSSARPFSVDGPTFLNLSAACGRACDVQHNLCADAANQGGANAGFTVGDCDNQDTACKAANP